ncbi:DUF3284 domain-containing protein [Clostridium sp. SHJSY1]|uniref:DUF3284 domain-containing protein n=1 Tax=Clostridium sp. SHJSY1 TaxID=2942483 RepID=UPI00287482D1|nr:DUF3284 domain-containing protein [Clostridium sp. SHJSY1]MDS0526175.1 DUF3284 domain-containing protein [Clostridium sp. SHJSY1]
MGFSNSAIIKYPVEKVFNLFIRQAKREFPKFNESNPIGCSITKRVGAYSVQSATLKVEITDYKKNELYQITSTSPDRIYYSTYEFEIIDENSTRITLIEEDKSTGFFVWFNVILQNILFKNRIKRRFKFFIEGLIREIEIYDEKLSKNSKTRIEEAKKEEAKAEARKAKEAALKVEREAKEARLAAEKAMEEAKTLEEQAKKAIKEAEDKASDID